jgi:hypothetical protein
LINQGGSDRESRQDVVGIITVRPIHGMVQELEEFWVASEGGNPILHGIS